MHIAARFCLVCSLLFLIAHRLPAPIAEESPTPLPQQFAKPKRAITKPQTPSPPPKKQATPNRNPFDGTWVGDINQADMGVNQFTLSISGSGTVLEWTSKWGMQTLKVACDGKTMRWNWKGKVLRGSCAFTPNPDGKTAIMTDQSPGFLGMHAFSSTTTFHKVSQ
jgi:hypothetical protein